MITVQHILKIETQAFFAHHHRYPMGREAEDVIDNAYMTIHNDNPSISYEEVYQYFIAHQRSIVRELEAK